MHDRLEQQRATYLSIRNKIRAGQFVNYHPVKAIRDNIPKPPKVQKLSYAEYYAKYGTTEEQGGWKMVKPEKQGDPPVHYIKEN